MNFIDMTGEVHGFLTVIERDTSRKGSYWKCKCSCGNIIIARRDQLIRANNPKISCNDCFAKRVSKQKMKNEIGKQYGYLTVIERVPDIRKGEARWRCKCMCGNETEVSGFHLRNGTVQSCGCKRYESHNCIDETGHKYGRLSVMKRSQKTDGTHVFWTCQCDCGSVIDVSGTNLRNGITQSCGCIKSKGEEEIAKFLIKHQILFKKEYTFKDLQGVGNGCLRFDFAIFNNNGKIIALIEFDGIQHYSQVKYFDNKQSFNDRQENDRRKNEYCQLNNFHLIRIKYNDIINIENILKNELKEVLLI